MLMISATDLARQTREILDTVALGGETFVVARNNVPVARILPPEPVMNAAQALADLHTALTREQAQAWLADSRGGFAEGVRDPWA